MFYSLLVHALYISHLFDGRDLAIFARFKVAVQKSFDATLQFPDNETEHTDVHSKSKLIFTLLLISRLFHLRLDLEISLAGEQLRIWNDPVLTGRKLTLPAFSIP